MINLLAEHYSQIFPSLKILLPITTRMILSAVFSLLLTFRVAPKVITWLQKQKVGQVVRKEGPTSHYDKAGTPTMGGMLILISAVSAILLFGDLKNIYLWAVLLTTLSYGVIGFIDDYRKLVLQHSKGLPAKIKYSAQSVIAIIFAAWLYSRGHAAQDTALWIPFFQNLVLPLGIFYFVLVYFVLVGSANAVNLTDGLDGLAVMPCVLVMTALGLFAYLSGHAVFAEHFSVPAISGIGEVSVVCAAFAGASLGFLWYNSYPAQVFMGDVGSLSLGALLGSVAILIHKELVLFIMGGIFVLETISVMIQVLYFKRTGERYFKMAPIHHHFELKGWPEPKVVVRFWILTVIFVLIGLGSLKISL